MFDDKIIEFNKRFVEDNGAEQYATTKYPDMKIAIVTCMDTRLVELLPAALGIKNGDVKMIKNAGGMIEYPWDSTMRSLLIGIYELGVEHIMIIAHTGCGVQGMEAQEMYHIMQQRGIGADRIDMVKRCGIDLDQWLTGFEDTAEAVRKSVALVRNHPLMPQDIDVKGYIFNTDSGLLQPID